MKSYILLIVTIALLYCYYDYQFFKYIEVETEVHPPRWKSIGITTAANYILFILCTLLKFHLIVNWFIFLICLYIEIRIIFRIPMAESLFYGLAGTLVGLSINIFFRSLIALIMNMPTSVFDNAMGTLNLKQYPIAIGFFLSGLFFHVVVKTGWKEKIKIICHDILNLRFFLRLIIVMYGYLSLNLLVYYVPGNSPILKLWSMKTSIYVCIGFYIVLEYGFKMSQLNEYRRQNSIVRQELASYIHEETKLRILAYRDTLTGCYNRKYAAYTLEKLVKERQKFCLSFIDLNGLKHVNDRFSHQMGDQYITAVADTLQRICRNEVDNVYRYGGDEFLILFGGMKAEQALEKMRMIDTDLQAKSNSEQYPFLLSVSYGIIDGDEYDNARDLLKEADARMYEKKLKDKAARKN